VSFSGPRGITIHCRPAALRRAVSKLLDNAVKYGQKAEVSLVPESEFVVSIIEDEAFRGANVTRFSSHFAGWKAPATATQAVSGSGCRLLVRSFTSMVATSNSPTAKDAD